MNSENSSLETHSNILVFNQWIEDQQRGKGFQAKTTVVYRSIWQTWTDWLMLYNKTWTSATGADVVAFLSGPPPGRKRHRKAIREDQLANFTQQRYWRVLRGVYATAHRHDMVAANPVLAVPDEARPSIVRQSLLPQVLPPSVLQQIQRPDLIVQLIPVVRETHWWSVRNQCVMAVLTHLGLSTSELGTLRGNCLRVNTTALVDVVNHWTQDSITDTDVETQLWLDVPPGGALAGRSLIVPSCVAELLRKHLLIRQALFTQRLKAQWSKSGHGSPTFEQALADVLRRSALFPSRKCVGGDKLNLPGIDEVTIFELVQAFMRRFFSTDQGQMHDPHVRGIHMGQGAAIIRNSLIRYWIASVGPEDAVALAGFESQESLRQHSALPPINPLPPFEQ